MSALRVGTRVKSVNCRYVPNNGNTGVILAASGDEYEVKWDRDFMGFDGLRGTRYPAGAQAWAKSYELEPIQPPKSQPVVTWDEAPFSRDGKWRETVTVQPC